MLLSEMTCDSPSIEYWSSWLKSRTVGSDCPWDFFLDIKVSTIAYFWMSYVTRDSSEAIKTWLDFLKWLIAVILAEFPVTLSKERELFFNLFAYWERFSPLLLRNQPHREIH